MTYDRDSFLSGLAVGRNLRGWPKLYGKYTLLDYISSDGNQWFETGICVKPVYTVSVTFRLNQILAAWMTVFGTRDYDGASAGGSRFTIRFHNTQDQLEWQRSRDDSRSYQTVDVYSVKNSFQANFRTVAIANTQALLDGTQKGTFGDAGTDVTFDRYPLVIFALNSAGNIGQGVSGDLRRAYVEDENGNPLAVYYPARRISDGAVGVYDTVSGRFVESGGTGSFIPHYFGEGNRT